ncbi:Candidapepsin-2 [Drechslerella dactyloides]|uniref:Candidapepsin-2 n=1 Tax=Drechslerella dactyloides TaxID=74499 RepID=A0AAD6IWP3_DREDA|nr:Candidapepsin-2 [Drechslerella dactyloides]
MGYHDSWPSRPPFRGLIIASLVLLHSFSCVVARSVERRQATQGQQYVVMPVKYNLTILGKLDGNLYANLQFEPNNQTVTLGITSDSVTWVPEQPASIASFCANSSNTQGCQIAGSVSGYYTPKSDVSRTDSFYYAYYGSDLNATGYWTDSTVSAGGVSIDLQFGVAQNWNSIPSLGLGLWPTIPAQKGPSYLAALEQQGKIAGQYVSCYDLTATSDSGSIIFGGVDLHKFNGKFTIWSNFNLPGIITTPSMRVLLGQNVSAVPEPRQAIALVNPFTPFMYLPDNLLNLIVKTLGAQTVNSIGGYGLPCNTQIDPTWQLEVSFSQLVINIPYRQLLSTATTARGDLCFLAVLPMSFYQTPGFNLSYVLGGPFFRSAYVVVNPTDNTTAIAVANPNVTSQNVVALGGPFGTALSSLQGVAPPPGSTETSVSNSTSSSKKSNTGAIVGGVVGGIGGLLLIGAGIWFMKGRKREEDAPIVPPGVSEHHTPELPGGGIIRQPTELDGGYGGGEMKKVGASAMQPPGPFAELPPHTHGGGGGGYEPVPQHQPPPPPGRHETYELA